MKLGELEKVKLVLLLVPLLALVVALLLVLLLQLLTRELDKTDDDEFESMLANIDEEEHHEQQVRLLKAMLSVRILSVFVPAPGMLYARPAYSSLEHR